MALGALLAPPAAADSYDDESLEMPEPEDPEADTKEPAEEEEPALSAGGLTAPAALGDPTDKPSEVEQELREGDEKDSGRGLEFAWLTGEFGFGVLDVTALGGGPEFLAEGEASGGSGVVFGGGLGVRLLYFTLGAHVRGGALDPITPLGVSAGASFKLPIGNLEPYVALDLGYLWVSGLASSSAFNGGLAGVGGMDLRLGIGADYYFSNYFSVGALVGGDLTFLSRPAYQASDFAGAIDPVYLQAASATGAAFSTALVVGFHL